MMVVKPKPVADFSLNKNQQRDFSEKKTGFNFLKV
jgi:hypothetical protein